MTDTTCALNSMSEAPNILQWLVALFDTFWEKLSDRMSQPVPEIKPPPHLLRRTQRRPYRLRRWRPFRNTS
ncbi:Hypothetical predicted protein [Pelobates cultripes]|uniref:Uncharacterized protein n=1 Tax=Pelobates cultripes TaxID=61616 RepID=A0AAD1RDG4_PELCU|nr:Hypothetical predicted protein [Pelobates cultripes]